MQPGRLGRVSYMTITLRRIRNSEHVPYPDKQQQQQHPWLRRVAYVVYTRTSLIVMFLANVRPHVPNVFMLCIPSLLSLLITLLYFYDTDREHKSLFGVYADIKGVLYVVAASVVCNA